MTRFPRGFPMRGVERVRRTSPVQRGAVSLTAAYERVAVATGLTAQEVAECYRQRRKHETPTVFTVKHALAMDMLDMSEKALEERIRRMVGHANALQPPYEGRPRFSYQHQWLAINSGSGWPDDVILDRKLHILYVFENKTEQNSPRPDQQAWLDDLAQVPGSIVVLGCMRPSSVDALYGVLGLPHTPTQRPPLEPTGQSF